MHPIKAINQKIQALKATSDSQSVPLNITAVALLCIEYTDAVTALLDAAGMVNDPAPEQAAGA